MLKKRAIALFSGLTFGTGYEKKKLEIPGAPVKRD
jgi:hypothetical protein